MVQQWELESQNFARYPDGKNMAASKERGCAGCRDLAPSHRAKALDDFPALRARVDEVPILTEGGPYKRYRCRLCGQIWDQYALDYHHGMISWLVKEGVGPPDPYDARAEEAWFKEEVARDATRTSWGRFPMWATGDMAHGISAAGFVVGLVFGLATLPAIERVGRDGRLNHFILCGFAGAGVGLALGLALEYSDRD